MTNPKQMSRALIEELLQLSADEFYEADLEATLNDFDYFDDIEGELDHEMLKDLRVAGF